MCSILVKFEDGVSRDDAETEESTDSQESRNGVFKSDEYTHLTKMVLENRKKKDFESEMSDVNPKGKIALSDAFMGLKLEY